MERRSFLKRYGIGGAGLVAAPWMIGCQDGKAPGPVKDGPGGPVAIATWNVPDAVNAAFDKLESGGSALDAVEAGGRVEEADAGNATVGLGGRPDREGQVTLDACVMDHRGECGSVAYLQDIVHPVSVARKVMEETPHVMLVGQGALRFALEQGFERRSLLTPRSEAEWRKWKEESRYEPIINIENHDTIGILALDGDGQLSGACTTSGMAYKMDGRVGDSPIIGAGLYVDNQVGAATATGMGEAVIRCVGSFLVVELMRQGRSPQEACEEAVGRIVEGDPRYRDLQVGYLALDKHGNHGAYSLHPGFQYRLKDAQGGRTEPSGSYL